MRITKIERQKKRASRKSIFIDGNFAFGVSDDVLLKFALHEGAELDEEAVERIAEAENEASAQQKALRLLGIRPRSKKEIRDYLIKKDFSAGLAERIIGKLESLRMLDDLAFARMVCRDLLAKKPSGEKMLRQQLVKKGVPAATVENVLQEFSTPEGEFEMALKAAEKQSFRIGRSSRTVDDDGYRKKILEYLLRRGFAFDTALRATKKILAK